MIWSPAEGISSKQNILIIMRYLQNNQKFPRVPCCSMVSPLWVEQSDLARVNMSSTVFPPPDVDWAITHTYTRTHTLSPLRPARSQRGGTVCSSQSQLSSSQSWVFSLPDSPVLHWPHHSMGLQTWPPSKPPLSSMACLDVETPSICRGKFKSGAFAFFFLSNLNAFHCFIWISALSQLKVFTLVSLCWCSGKGVVMT